MENDLKNIDDLIFTYLEEKASPEEEETLLQWVKQSEENRKYFIEHTDLHQTAAAESLQFDYKKALRKVKKQNNIKESKVRSLIATVTITAAATIVLAFTLWNFYSKPTQIAPQIAEYSTADTILGCHLQDSSVITLNKNTALKSSFAGSTRLVNIAGNAYFEVARDTNRPFIVRAGFVEIRVLGTKFNVKQDSIEESVAVSVVEGSVLCTHLNTNEQVTLKRGEQATFYLRKEMQKKLLSNNNFLAWKTGLLIYDNMPLGKAVPELEEYYGQKIELNTKGLENCPLNAKLNRYSLDEVLKMFEIAFNIKVKKQGGVIYLEGTPCNSTEN